MNDSIQNTAAGNSAADRQNFLRQSKLSRLPKLPARASNLVTARKSICISCQSNLSNESAFARRIKVCASCLKVYAVIDDAITKANAEKAYSENADLF